MFIWYIKFVINSLPVVVRRLFIAEILAIICVFPSFALGIDQTYQLYSGASAYYLKAKPVWVPIGQELFFMIPLYKAGRILELKMVNGTWVVKSISLSEFNTAAPAPLSESHVQYIDINSDGHLDMQVTLENPNGVVHLLNDGTSSAFVASVLQRRVIFIHTDLLGSPAAETDAEGKIFSR